MASKLNKQDGFFYMNPHAMGVGEREKGREKVLSFVYKTLDIGLRARFSRIAGIQLRISIYDYEIIAYDASGERLGLLFQANFSADRGLLDPLKSLIKKGKKFQMILISMTEINQSEVRIVSGSLSSVKRVF